LPPIRVFEKDGAVYSLDNRRLLAASEAGVPIKVVPATPAEVAKEGGVKNVGWINVESEFSLGEMPKSTLHKLKSLATGGGVFQPLVEPVRELPFLSSVWRA